MQTAEQPLEDGFSLVETLIAMLVLTTGLVGMAQLLAVALVLQSDAREAERSIGYAVSKIGELEAVDAGTLAGLPRAGADVPDVGVTREWQIDPGPIARTTLVTVRVTNRRARQYGAAIGLTSILAPE